MARKRQLTDFGKQIKTQLIEINETQDWLINQVSESTGLYFDGSYLYRIQTGQLSSPKIVDAIRKILNV